MIWIATSRFNFQERQSYTCDATTLREDYSPEVDPARVLRDVSTKHGFLLVAILLRFACEAECEL